jgi:Palmitoyl protein thioesterase
MFQTKRVAQKLFSIVTLVAILAAPFTAIAQKAPKGNAQASSKSGTVAAKCSGAWTGIITYTRTQGMTNNKTVERVSGRGEDTTTFEMKYDYKAQVVVAESPEKNGSSVGKATINMSLTSNETVVAKEKNSCDRGKSWQEMTGTSTSKSETSGSGKEDASLNVGVDADGAYSISVALPPIPGKVTGSQSTTFSGQCTAKEGKTFNMPPSATSIDGNSLTSDGTNRVDPNEPNKLSGSYSKTWQNVTETITWNLKKCGAPLRITDLKFEDMKFPNWNDWKEITEQAGTIDGNFVKIKATVINASGETKYADIKFKETYKGDKWDGAKPDAPLNDNVESVKLDPGEEKEVEMLWDSSGYSWYDDGRPRLVQRIKAELEENGRKTDEMTKNLKVAPKPVVLVHGLWSDWKQFETWQNILTTSHSYDWKAFPVGEKPEHGALSTGGAFMSTEPTKSIEQNARVLQAYIKYAQEDRNAWHVDIVAHSIGGLIARQYIHQIMMPEQDSMDPRPKVSHLVMLGTPNQGTPCADVMSTAFELVGKKVEALHELRTDVVRRFNGLVFNRKGVKFSALAGNPLPNTCKELTWNDGFVTVPSAIYNVADHAESKSIHTDLTGTKDFSDFVKPHLAIGPKGDHNSAAPSTPSGFMASSETTSSTISETAVAEYSPSRERMSELFPRFYGMREVRADLPEGQVAPGLATPFARTQKVAPKQIVEIEIPVDAAQNLGLTFMADPSISLTLIDGTGAVAGKNLSTSPEAKAIFRSIFIDKPVTAGAWKARVENTGAMELEIVLTTWSNAVK